MSQKPRKKEPFLYSLWRVMFYGMLLIGALFLIFRLISWIGLI